MSMTDSATLIINLKLVPDNLDQFQLPDLLQDGISIASLAKVTVDPFIQDLINDQNKEDDEIFSITKVWGFVFFFTFRMDFELRGWPPKPPTFSSNNTKITKNAQF